MFNLRRKKHTRFKEFLLSPVQFGVPNSRLRYFLIARRGQTFCFSTSDQICESYNKKLIVLTKSMLLLILS